MASRAFMRFNGTSRAKANRERYVAENGGKFVKRRAGWFWEAEVVKPKAEPKSAPKAPKKKASPKK
tara:strand:+ start:490 stop:687 length:198 start_codon:yes stop_codon:yes gene_type:complete